jgi:16S rRNA (guanine527-N7)-methyltransferase
MTQARDRRVNRPPASIEPERMATLLRPFLPAALEAPQLAAISTYVDLLLRWNAKLNLTAVREPENIVTRHIGESLFCATHLLRPDALPSHMIDVGSGAGFPGLPLKIYAAHLRLTLIEAQQKKATFLKEVIRALQLTNTDVFPGRAECFRGRGHLVTMRAVERFEQVLPMAAALLDRPASHVGHTVVSAPSHNPPRLALLIGAAQAERARRILSGFRWDEPELIPQSEARILLVGEPQ